MPIIEPEVLRDGNHSLKTSVKINEKVLKAVMSELQSENILMEGLIF